MYESLIIVHFLYASINVVLFLLQEILRLQFPGGEEELYYRKARFWKY